MIDNDAVGKLGEAQFNKLCAEASLICNPSTQDRAGWDYLVDFRSNEVTGATLDRRIAPMSCYIQVKTVNVPKTSVRLKLNMAERLAKEPKPCFIFVLRVEGTASVDASLIHVSDARLDKILRQLRIAERDKKDPEKLNKISITFTPNESKKIALSGDALKAAIQKCAGKDIDEYIKKKSAEIKTTGFEERPFQISVHIETKNVSELTDLFLGLKKNIDVRSVQFTETRFGIALSGPVDEWAKLALNPSPVDECTIFFTRANALVPSVFRGKVFMAPPLPGGSTTYLIVGDSFSIKARRAEPTINLFLEFQASDRELSAAHWLNHFDALNALYHSDVTIEVISDRTQAKLEFTITQDSFDRTSWVDPNYMLTLWKGLNELVSKSGDQAALKFKYDDVFNCSRELIFAYSMLDEREKSELKFLVETYQGEIADGEILFIIYLDVGTNRMAYYAKAQIKHEKLEQATRFILSDFKLKRVRFITATADAFEAFQQAARKTEGMELVVISGTLDDHGLTGQIS